MKKFYVTLTMALCLTVQLEAETAFNERPKLVVGIVVDQMRWDYLSRYYDIYRQDGLKRLMTKGYSCDNCLINYLPTVTAIGHTSIYTGTTPAFHGICGNVFYVDGVSAIRIAHLSCLPGAVPMPPIGWIRKTDSLSAAPGIWMTCLYGQKPIMQR